MWFWLAVTASLCWSGSDLFSKIGCVGKDKYSHLKMLTSVGVVMGCHAFYSIFFDNVTISFLDFLKYLPVSVLYILSMALGYAGLRYIELSVSSPICNCSGAIVAVLCIITGSTLDVLQYLAVTLICFGVIGMGFTEAKEDETLRAERQKEANYQYSKSAVAIILPVLYCLLDALGTFSDSLVLKTLDEKTANTSYEITFFICGLVSFIIVKFIKKQKFTAKDEAPKLLGAIFETAGQFAYIFAIADQKHIAASAPIISAYCLISVLWGRIFLKEKLTFKHYSMILIACIGIVILGIYDV